jgi:hypothetical protein
MHGGKKCSKLNVREGHCNYGICPTKNYIPFLLFQRDKQEKKEKRKEPVFHFPVDTDDT